MIRTFVAIFIIVCSILFLPFWVQISLFVLAILFVRYRVLLLIPALFADAWYSPVRDFSLANNKITVIVIMMLVIYIFIIRTTRIRERYGLEKK